MGFDFASSKGAKCSITTTPDRPDSEPESIRRNPDSEAKHPVVLANCV